MLGFCAARSELHIASSEASQSETTATFMLQLYSHKVLFRDRAGDRIVLPNELCERNSMSASLRKRPNCC